VQQGTPGGAARGDQIFHDFVLAVDGDGASAGQFFEVDAMTVALEGHVDAAVAYALTTQTVAQSGLGEEVDSPLLKDAGAHAFDHIITAAVFDYDGVDAFEVQQMSQEQPRGSGPHDRHLSAEARHTRSMMAAMPCPTPMHIVQSAYRPPDRSSW
jgi:hypothetical protein